MKGQTFHVIPWTASYRPHGWYKTVHHKRKSSLYIAISEIVQVMLSVQNSTTQDEQPSAADMLRTRTRTTVRFLSDSVTQHEDGESGA